MYYIVELQTTGEVGALLQDVKADKNEALSEYHRRLMYAAISQVEYHTVLVVTEEGQYIARETFYHEQPQPEPEPQPEETIGGEDDDN